MKVELRYIIFASSAFATWWRVRSSFLTCQRNLMGYKCLEAFQCPLQPHLQRQKSITAVTARRNPCSVNRFSLGSPFFASTLSHNAGADYMKMEEDSDSYDINRRAKFILDMNDSDFQFPHLSQEDVKNLSYGKRIQRQFRDRNAGTGIVAVDVKADPSTVLEILQRYGAYKDMIDTVREATVIECLNDCQTKAEFLLSKFKFRVIVILTAEPEKNLLKFELDPSCTGVGRSVFKEAKGIWYIDSGPHIRPGYCRVYLMAKLIVSSFVPGFLVDYAATRALPRATTWLKPTCERIQRIRDREKERREMNSNM